MKKWTLFISAYLCLCLLAACGAGTGGAVPPSGGTSSGGTRAGGEAAGITETFRVVTSEEGAFPLLLARQDGAGEDVYRLEQTDAEILLDGVSAATADILFRPGALLDVTCDGSVLETFPARFGSVSGLNLRSDGFDDRCRLYLDVLEDLWSVDEGLNGGITELGVDLSATSLPASERAAVAWAFGEAHGIAPVQGTYAELVEQGYITGEPLGNGAPEDAKFWQWEEGCLFSVAEQAMEGTYSLTPVTFDAQKWRSGLGAYYFMDCTAIQSAGGAWGDYAVGSEAIS